MAGRLAILHGIDTPEGEPGNRHIPTDRDGNFLAKHMVGDYVPRTDHSLDLSANVLQRNFYVTIEASEDLLQSAVDYLENISITLLFSRVRQSSRYLGDQGIVCGL